MKKPGLELTINWREVYPDSSPMVVGVFVLLSLTAIKYFQGSLPDDDKQLSDICEDYTSVKDEVRKLFIIRDGVLLIPDILNYKIDGKATRFSKGKVVARDPNFEHNYSIEQMAQYEKFIKWITENAPRVNQMDDKFTITQYMQLTSDGWSAVSVKEILLKMQNYKPLLQKNKSSYLTLLNWLRNPYNQAVKTGNQVPSTTKAGAQIDIHQKVKEQLNGN